MIDTTPDNSPRQLSLGVQLSDQLTFSNFLTDFFAANGSVQFREIANLKRWLEQWCQFPDQSTNDAFVFLAGPSGSGRSHLLQASCHVVAGAGRNAIYLPLNEFYEKNPEQILEGLSDSDLVCIDDLDLVAGNSSWERGLFNLFNEIRDNQNYLLVAAHAAPGNLGITLPDLTSRLGWGPVFKLPELDDLGKQQLLVFRAGIRGLELSDDCARYLLQRASRNNADLIGLLDRLDLASLEQKRSLTIPFIRQLLDR